MSVLWDALALMKISDEEPLTKMLDHDTRHTRFVIWGKTRQARAHLLK